MNFEVINGQLNIRNGNEVLFREVTAYLNFPGNHDDIITRKAEGVWKTDGAAAVCDNMRMEITDVEKGLFLHTTFINTGEDITVPGEFKCFAGNLSGTIDRAVCNRYIHWPNTNRACEMQSVMDTIHTVYNDIYESADYATFDTVEREAFVFGAATYKKYFSGVTVSREGHITAHCYTEVKPILHGDSCTSETFFFAQESDCVTALELYARTVANMAGVERITRENPTGFCTWYYYGGGISPKTLQENIAVLEEHRKDLPVKYVQIDDGWHQGWGDWYTNSNFPDMKEIADEIKAHGYLPGIWIAPMGYGRDSRVTKEHPEWLVHNPDGSICEVYNGPCIDYTHPTSRAFMAEFFRRISYEWGYRYIKMDIITNCLAVGVYYDKNATALENYRLGLETVRANVTPDTFLLGCTAPFGGAIGLVDGMRVTCDVFERWESIRNVFNEALKRFHYHRNYFLCDADCLIIRKKENEDEECFRPCTRNDTEIRTYITAMAATGGILMLSDKLPNLEEYQLELISKLFPVNQEAARPLDLMDSFIPGILDFGWHGRTRTVAFINWGDAERTLSLDMEAAIVWEFWEKEFRVHEGKAFTVKLAPHASKVFYFTDTGDMVLCGSNASVMMQTMWEAEEGCIYAKRLKETEHTYAAVRREIVKTVGCAAEELTRVEDYILYQISPETEEYKLYT